MVYYIRSLLVSKYRVSAIHDRRHFSNIQWYHRYFWKEISIRWCRYFLARNFDTELRIHFYQQGLTTLSGISLLCLTVITKIVFSQHQKKCQGMKLWVHIRAAKISSKSNADNFCESIGIVSTFSRRYQYRYWRYCIVLQVLLSIQCPCTIVPLHRS